MELPILKALFNNVFTFKNLRCMSLIKCQNEALKKLHFKSIIKVLHRSENRQVTGFTTLIFPHRLLF